MLKLNKTEDIGSIEDASDLEPFCKEWARGSTLPRTAHFTKAPILLSEQRTRTKHQNKASTQFHAHACVLRTTTSFIFQTR